MKSLIVDDVLIIRNMLERILKQYGGCDVAPNGAEAIQKFENNLKNNPYDLICLDIMMPNTDGLKVVETVREMEEKNSITDSAKVKIVMITAMSEMDFVNSALKMGCDDYIIKPVNNQVLLKKLKKLGLIE